MLIFYIFIFFASFLFYILYEGAFSFYLFAFIIILPVVLIAIQKIQSKEISVSFLNVLKSTSKSTKIPITLKIINRTKFPVGNLIIEIEYKNYLETKTHLMKINTPVYGKDTQYLTMYVAGKHYGTFTMKIKRARICDMLKLTKFNLAFLEEDTSQRECSFTIIPDFIPIENNISNYSEMGLETDDFSKTTKGDDPSEIFDIHEYIEGDKINRIHWKLSAKSDKTMVKDYSLPISNSILLLIDLYFDYDDENYLILYDALIEAVTAISAHLLSQNVPHKVVWFDVSKNELICLDITNDDYENIFIGMLLRTPLYKESGLSLINYINDSTNSKCGHLMFFSTVYNQNTSAVMNENNLSFRYSYLLSTNDSISTEDEFSQIIPIIPNHVAQSIEDICL